MSQIPCIRVLKEIYNPKEPHIYLSDNSIPSSTSVIHSSSTMESRAINITSMAGTVDGKVHSPSAPPRYRENDGMPNGTENDDSTDHLPPSIDGSSILKSKADEMGDDMRRTVNGETNGITNGTTKDTQESPYRVLEQWHSKPTHLRLIHVGAGAGGLLLAYKMKRQFTNYELVCYEKYVELLTVAIFRLHALQKSPHRRHLVRESISWLRLRRVSLLASLRQVPRCLAADSVSSDLLMRTRIPLNPIRTGLAFTRRLPRYDSILRTSRQSMSSNSL